MNRQELYFTVAGVEPGPQGSKRHVGNGVMIEASKKVAPFRAAVAEAVFRAFVATGDDRIFTDPVVVWATFYLPKPPSVKRILPSVAPDLDKLQRTLGDALSINAGVIKDDSLIVRWHATKLYAATPSDIGVRVAVKTVALAEADKDKNNASITFHEKLHFLSECD